MGYRTIEEIKAANTTARLHFFASGLMRLRETFVYPKVYFGRYFITSERNVMLAGSPRGFSIREVLPDSSIKLVGRFQQFQTLGEAKDAIQRLAGDGAAGREGDRLIAKPRSTGRGSIAIATRSTTEDSGYEKLDAVAVERLRELKRDRLSKPVPGGSGLGPDGRQLAEPARQNAVAHEHVDERQAYLDRRLKELDAPSRNEPSPPAGAIGAPAVELDEKPLSLGTRIGAARRAQGSALLWLRATARRRKQAGSQDTDELGAQNLKTKQNPMLSI